MRAGLKPLAPCPRSKFPHVVFWGAGAAAAASRERESVAHPRDSSILLATNQYEMHCPGARLPGLPRLGLAACTYR